MNILISGHQEETIKLKESIKEYQRDYASIFSQKKALSATVESLNKTIKEREEDL